MEEKVYKVKVDFEYPIGDVKVLASKGEKGDKGDRGDRGPRGFTGATGPANQLSIGTVTGGENASATITGTSPSQILNLVLPKGDKGDDGTNGTDGFSPTASVSKSGNTATITITDKNGTTTASVSDGTNGTNGTNGTDGFSPTASVSKSGNTATITITDKNGTTTASVSDGVVDWNTQKATVSGTTDGSGFLSVPRTTIAPSTGVIIGARLKSLDGTSTAGASFIDILTNFNDSTHDAYSLRLKNWDDTAWASKSAEVEIVYVSVS